MDTLNTIRTLGLAAVVASLPALIAIAANAQSPAPAPQTAPGAVKVVPPPAADMDAGPTIRDTTRDSGPAKSADPSSEPSSGKAPDSGSSANAAPGGGASLKDVTVGAAVFGSDGQKIGEIKGVKSDSGGKIEEIHVKTGGLLGFGGKVVVVPAGKIAKGGQTVQVAMTAVEIGKLPALAEGKG
jgi:PRC-barrel domain